MRVLRMIVGVLLVLLALPLLTAGACLLLATQHRSADGAYTARLERFAVHGRAVIADDFDAMLHDQAPYARATRTTLRITASDSAGAMFIGLAPRSAAAGYLSDVGYTAITQVRLARGPLPVATEVTSGTGTLLGQPVQRSFWLLSTVDGSLSYSPAQYAGEDLTLVIMRPDGTVPSGVMLSAAVTAGWLVPTMYSLLSLGTLAVISAIILLAWPSRRREYLCVVDPSQVPDIAARLGLVPAARAGVLGAPAPEPAGCSALEVYRGEDERYVPAAEQTLYQGEGWATAAVFGGQPVAEWSMPGAPAPVQLIAPQGRPGRHAAAEYPPAPGVLDPVAAGGAPYVMTTGYPQRWPDWTGEVREGAPPRLPADAAWPGYAMPDQPVPGQPAPAPGQPASSQPMSG